jgi:hypothetical protein
VRQFAGGVREVALSSQESFADRQMLSRVHEGASDVGALTYSSLSMVKKHRKAICRTLFLFVFDTFLFLPCPNISLSIHIFAHALPNRVKYLQNCLFLAMVLFLFAFSASWAALLI